MLRHTLCRKPYGRKILYEKVWISHELMNTGSMLKVDYNSFLMVMYVTVYITNWRWSNFVPTVDEVLLAFCVFVHIDVYVMDKTACKMK
jgi:hypothetical protein